MTRRQGLSTTLFSKSRLAILSLLFLDSASRFYLKQVVSLTGLGVGAVQRELAALTDCGILTREREGRQVYFQVNPACPVSDELRSIIIKTGGVADVLRERLEGLRQRIRVAFVYGSLAEGEDCSESDIDVMVIGAASFAEISRALGDVQLALRREVNPTVYPVPEFKRKVDTPFLKSVLTKPKIFLVGGEDDLKGLAE